MSCVGRPPGRPFTVTSKIRKNFWRKSGALFLQLMPQLFDLKEVAAFL